MKNPPDYQNRLFDIINNKVFTAEFISGIAGDKLQSLEDKDLYSKLLEESEGDFYVKLLFFITHEIFEKERATKLWLEILEHKNQLSKILNRNVEITVAALDYLTNIKNEIANPKIIGEAFIGKIAEISSIDPLTGMYNRQHLRQLLNNEFARYKRYKIPFSLIMIDIDHFKKVNDTFGHQAGDGVLIAISKIINENLRELDICTRYGGDEFLIVLPHTDEGKAFEIGERIRIKVIESASALHAVTLSVGIATCPYHADTIKSLIKIADEALYSSKSNGKNKTTIPQSTYRTT